MKKCNRCSNVIDWDRPFCPLCGGQVIDVPRSERADPIIETIPAVAENIGIPQVVGPPSPPVPPSPPAPQLPTSPPSPPAPQLPPANIAHLPPPPVSPIQAAAMAPPTATPTISPPIPPASPMPPVSPPASVFDDFQMQTKATAGKPTFPLESTTPPAGSISQIHQPPAPPISSSRPEAPPTGINQQEDPLAAFLKSGRQSQAAPDVPRTAYPEPEADDTADGAYNPLDTLLREEKVVSLNVDTGNFDDPFAEIFKRIAPDTNEPEREREYPVDDPIEALLKTGPRFDAGAVSTEIGDASLFLSADDSEEVSSQFPPSSPPTLDKNVIPNLPDDIKPNPDGDNSQDDFLRMFPRAKG